MKLIIDIPEWKYKSICEGIEASKRCGVVGIDPDIHEAIYNGKPYKERPQGEWIAITSPVFDNKIHIICSNCKEEFVGENDIETWKNEYLFCHRCGADMRKGGAE